MALSRVAWVHAHVLSLSIQYQKKDEPQYLPTEKLDCLIPYGHTRVNRYLDALGLQEAAYRALLSASRTVGTLYIIPLPRTSTVEVTVIDSIFIPHFLKYFLDVTSKKWYS
jgi:hypothetical protein